MGGIGFHNKVLVMEYLASFSLSFISFIRSLKIPTKDVVMRIERNQGAKPLALCRHIVGASCMLNGAVRVLFAWKPGWDLRLGPYGKRQTSFFIPEL